MMTNKTDNLLEKLIYCDFRTDVGIDMAKSLIRRALIRQDKETRNRCVEMVQNAHEMPETTVLGRYHKILCERIVKEIKHG